MPHLEHWVVVRFSLLWSKHVLQQQTPLFAYLGFYSLDIDSFFVFDS